VPSQKLQSVQYLRAIAALMVAYLHLPGQIAAYSSLLTGPRWIGVTSFDFGVDIFFVISGFIMVATSQRLGPRAFLLRRLIRIVPLYWIATMALVAAALLMPSLFKETSPNLLDGARSLLFIAFHNAAQDGKILPLLVPGWTLNLEMCFYAIFTITLFAWIRPYQIWVTGILFSMALVIGLNLSHHDSLLAFYSQPRIFEFWIGMLIARVFSTTTKSMPATVAYALIALGFLLRLPPLPSVPVNTAIKLLKPALCVIGAIYAERRGAMPKLPRLELLGDASYSIYLTHIFTEGATRTIWHWLPIDTGVAAGIAFAIFSMSSVIGIALLSYQYIEKPTLKWLLNASTRSRTSHEVIVDTPSG
jgi:exopolysaccharide production protein ExoZ